MYLFPRFEFPEKMIKEAEGKGIKSDTFYALELLNSTGVVIHLSKITNILNNTLSSL